SAAWLLPMRPGDQIAAGSLAIYAEAAQQGHGSWLIYADDDLVCTGGARQSPHFKPDWNPELFEHHDFISGSSIVRADREALANLLDLGWSEALVRAALDQGSAPIHLRLVLHHRISRPQPVVPAKAQRSLLGTAPAITAIIPTRDGHRLLRNSVDGLRRTAYPHIETIIVDNDSQDQQTLDYLAELEGEGVKILRV